MRFDCLSDSSQLFATLINCDVQDNEIKCGFAWFLGGISGDIELFAPDGQSSFLILIPEEVGMVATAHVLCDPKDSISIKRLKI